MDEYFKSLSDWGIGQVTQAVQDCITDEVFFPKPAVLIKALIEGAEASHEQEGEHQRALPEYHDPAVARKALADMKRIAALAATVKAMPAEGTKAPKAMDEAREEAKKQREQYERVQMQEWAACEDRHWLARFRLGLPVPEWQRKKFEAQGFQAGRL